MKNRSGIYEIFNTENGKRYVGQAEVLERRRKLHFRQLKRGIHHSAPLQNAWNKYGESAFKFRVILTCTKSMLTFYEQQLLDKAKPEYNVCKIAGTTIGYKHTPETKALMTAQRLGKKHTPEHRAAIADGGRGRHPTEETRKKLSEAKKNRIVSDETREKIREIRTGKSLSAEARQKVSDALTGRVVSDQTREKLRVANRGHIVSEETRRKIGDANRRRERSPRKPEHCEAISQRQKIMWAARRAAGIGGRLGS